MIQWLGAGYTLAMAIGLITGGRLGDLYGRKRMFMIGAAGFAPPRLSARSPRARTMLITARVPQGLFGAVMLPQGLGMIKEMFPPKEMAAAFGAFGPVMGLSAVGGPILAGWLVTADYFGSGWRMIFLINLPLGLAAVLGAVKFLPVLARHPRDTARPIAASLIMSVAASDRLPAGPGSRPGLAGLDLRRDGRVGVGFAAFGVHQARRRRGGDPLVTPSLFRQARVHRRPAGRHRVLRRHDRLLPGLQPVPADRPGLLAAQDRSGQRAAGRWAW